MPARFRPSLSYANVMATVAVFLALGGAGYAAVSINGKDIKNRTISAQKVRKHTLTGTEIKLSKLGTVPAASKAKTAGLATNLVAPEALHLVGNPGQPVFQNGWKNEGFDLGPAAFYKDREGIVHLQGNVVPGGTTTFPSHMFTLPPGYRPAADQEFAAVMVHAGTSAIEHEEVQKLGDVVLYDTVTGDVSLSGVTFRAGH